MKQDEFRKWFLGQPIKDDGRNHLIALLEEAPATRVENLNTIADMVQVHYESETITADRLLDLGAPKTAALLREKLPTTKKARSGELGEILATEIAERFLGWDVPVRRTRWKDGRDMALRGDDLTAIWQSEDGELWFLKGESKSRAGSISSAISDASEALDQDEGRPSRISVIFVADRLRESGEGELALEIENALVDSFKDNPIHHLLFTMSGTDPKKLLTEHFESLEEGQRRRYVIGLRVRDHAEFIRQIYEAL